MNPILASLSLIRLLPLRSRFQLQQAEVYARALHPARFLCSTVGADSGSGAVEPTVRPAPVGAV